METFLDQKDITGFYVNKSQSCGVAGNNCMAYICARTAYNFKNSDQNTIENFITALFNIGDYENCVKLANKWFNNSNSPDISTKGLIHFLKGKSLIKLREY